MEISFYSIVLWITSIYILSLAIVTFIGANNLSSRLFSTASLFTSIWVATQGFFISISNPYFMDILVRIQHILGISIAIIIYLFSIAYPHNKKISQKKIFYVCMIFLFFTFLYLFTDSLIIDVSMTNGIGHWIWNFGKWHMIFDTAFYSFWTISLLNIYKTSRLEIGKLHINIRNMLIALILGIIPPTLANILLPSLGIYQFNWIGPITSFIWVSIIGYSIIRYNQMNIKSVIAEIIVIAMTMVFFINIFTDIDTDLYIRVTTFFIFILLAAYLIKGTFREQKQREDLQLLNSTLEQKVAEQTQEVRHAFELEKKAKRDLEKLNDTKDQFIMITQHNLRTPVTSIRWELEAMLSGTYGELSSEMVKALNDTNVSVKHLTRIVDDFLNITAIKAGSQILKISGSSLKQAVEDVFAELKIDIEDKHILINYPKDDINWPVLKIDESKMREVILIIIENAIRYNIDNGKITINTKVEDSNFIMTVENTGIGIVNKDSNSLFSRLFFRSKQAQSVNPSGMGIGLFVSRAILRAHHGDIKIYSDGENKGATVTLNLPVDFLADVAGDNN